ncbi:hypothetical protein BDV97DRAFT_51479 [Delphinella strobiligena]|nr:hypothetical protein BDV97DRAFT_51479 [Delphinella strobiligena]
MQQSHIAASEQYRILSSYLSDSLDLDATLPKITEPVSFAIQHSQPAPEPNEPHGSPHDTPQAQKYSVYPISAELKDQLWNHLSQTWGSIHLLASLTPHDSPKQSKLVELLAALAQQPPLEDPHGKKQVIEYAGGRLWTDLPYFALLTREVFNWPDPRKAVDQEAKEHWINFNSFLARLTTWELFSQRSGASATSHEALDYSKFGIWSLRNALEEEDQEGREKGDTTDALTGAAAVWIVYAATTLRRLRDKEKEYPAKTGKPGARFSNEKQWRGYCAERWQIWEHEFAKAEEITQDEHIKDLVGKARQIMKG